MTTTQIRGSTQIKDNTVTVVKLNMDADLPMGTHKITGLVDGVNPQDAVTKAQLDGIAGGVDIKGSVRAASVGANLTLSGTQTVDGIALTAGNRILVKNQTAPAENGIYVVAAGAWSRSPDADVSAEVTSGMFTFVEQGTVNAGTGWVLTTPDPIVLNTTALTFTQFSGAGAITAGDGLTQTGTTIAIGTPSNNTSTSTNAVTADSHSHAIDSTIARSAITISAGTGLSGGGDLTANRTITLADHTHQSAGAAGGKLDHGDALNGLADDDHNQYWNDSRGDAKIATHTAVKTAHGLVSPTAANDFMIGSGVGVWALKTLAEAKSILGIVAGATNAYKETPTGAINGSNAAFVLAHTPVAGSEHVYRNGILQNAGGNDYTLATATITFEAGSIPQTGDVVLVTYAW